MKRLLKEGNPTFSLEDFSFSAHADFWNAFLKSAGGEDEAEVRKARPTISARLQFSYGKDEPLGPLGEFVVDIDPDCTDVRRASLG